MCNWKTCVGVGSLLWGFVMAGQPWAVAKDVLLKTDLETSPLADGWKLDLMVYSYQPHDWFLRDPIHGNNRGKQAIGRLLAEYLEPRDKG